MQYRRSVDRLFEGVQLPEYRLAEIESSGAFDNEIGSQSTTESVIRSYLNASQGIADAASSQRDWVNCPVEDDGCVTQTALALAGQAWRRPLTATERQELGSLVADLKSQLGDEDALQLTIEAILQSSNFLYLPEIGDPSIDAPDGHIALSAHEMATRLSFLLWQEPPSQNLLAAAEDGELDTAEGVRTQAERMLDEPQADRTLAMFHRQWFGLDGLDELALDSERYPELDDELRAQFQSSSEMFAVHTVQSGGTVKDLFTSREAFVNDRLAPFYGVDAPGTDELARMTLPEGRRAGILTQPGFLASTSHGKRHSPIMRGVTVLEAVLCAPAPPPPPDVADSVESEDESGDGPAMTTRQMVAESHREPQCASCHTRIDGIGFAFENYDAIGKWQETENGVPVDNSGELHGTDVDGAFHGAVELSEKLAQSRQVSRCVVEHWLEYSFGQNLGYAQACLIDHVHEQLLASNGEIKPWLLDFVSSPTFRYRRTLDNR
jgi:hypothetical protein